MQAAHANGVTIPSVAHVPKAVDRQGAQRPRNVRERAPSFQPEKRLRGEESESESESNIGSSVSSMGGLSASHNTSEEHEFDFTQIVDTQGLNSMKLGAEIKEEAELDGDMDEASLQMSADLRLSGDSDEPFTAQESIDFLAMRSSADFDQLCVDTDPRSQDSRPSVLERAFPDDTRSPIEPIQCGGEFDSGRSGQVTVDSMGRSSKWHCSPHRNK
jgi:hypothetical protein